MIVVWYKSMFNFVKQNTRLSSKVAVTTLNSHQQREFLLFQSPVSPSFVIVRVLDFGYSNKCVVVFHCGFNLHFPDDI